MTKIIQAKFKISRRLGKNVWHSPKDAFEKRKSRPGQHGAAATRKVSDHGKQLNAKQLLKGYYGRINEHQFKNIFKEAFRMRGDTGQNLIGLLERRLDAVVYRLNFSRTIFGARQLVSHKHIMVNGSKVNIPSYKVKVGDVISISDKSKELVIILENVKHMEREVPDYLEFDAKSLSAKYTRIPRLEEVPYPVVMEPHLVVEFYSK